MVIMGTSRIGVGLKHFVIRLEGRRLSLRLRFIGVFLSNPPLNDTWLFNVFLSTGITIVVSWFDIIIEAELA